MRKSGLIISSLIINVIPIIGVLYLNWEAVSLILYYWLEIATFALFIAIVYMVSPKAKKEILSSIDKIDTINKPPPSRALYAWGSFIAISLFFIVKLYNAELNQIKILLIPGIFIIISYLPYFIKINAVNGETLIIELLKKMFVIFIVFVISILLDISITYTVIVLSIIKFSFDLIPNKLILRQYK